MELLGHVLLLLVPCPGPTALASLQQQQMKTAAAALRLCMSRRAAVVCPVAPVKPVNG
jgi:hypothetical protein